MSAIYVNYDVIESSSNVIAGHNGKLLERLHNIQKMINDLSGDWESDSAVRIREKITAMETRFQQYHDVVDNQVKFLRNVVKDYRAIESTNTANADRFI